MLEQELGERDHPITSGKRCPTDQRTTTKENREGEKKTFKRKN
jgi:hypothetical protein